MAKKSILSKARAQLDASAAATAAEVTAAADRSRPEPARKPAPLMDAPLEAVMVNPRNVRAGEIDVTDLVASVAEVGVLEPVIVRPVSEDDRAGGGVPEGARYVLVMGERRWTAAREAGLATIPAVVRPDITRSNERQMMLIENLQRHDLSPIDEARAFSELIEAGISQRTLAAQIGMTQPHISRRLSLLKLAGPVQDLLHARRLGSDVAVSHLAKLSEQMQAQVVEHLTTTATGTCPADATDSDGDSGVDRTAAEGRDEKPLGAAEVKAAVAAVRRARRRAETAQASQDRAAVRGAKVVPPAEVRDQLGESWHEHRLYADADIEAAAGRDELLAVLGQVSGPAYYTAGSAPVSVTQQSAAAERQQHKEMLARLTRWVTSARRPQRRDLVDPLAEYVVATMPREERSAVYGWLRGSVGADVDDAEDWAASLQRSDYPQVAWLVSVARDMRVARQAPNSPAGRRTQTRLDELAVTDDAGASATHTTTPTIAQED